MGAMISESLLYIERMKGEEVEMRAYVFWKCQYLTQGAKPVFIRIRMNTLEKLCSCKMFCCEIFLEFFYLFGLKAAYYKWLRRTVM